MRVLPWLTLAAILAIAGLVVLLRPGRRSAESVPEHRTPKTEHPASTAKTPEDAKKTLVPDNLRPKTENLVTPTPLPKAKETPEPKVGPVPEPKDAAAAAKWDAIKAEAKKLADAGKFDEALKALDAAKALPLEGIADLVLDSLDSIESIRSTRLKAALAAYQAESDKLWALFKARDYPAADALLKQLAADPRFVGGASLPRVPPRAGDGPPTMQDMLNADQEAARLLKGFWAAVERGVLARKGKFVSIAGKGGNVESIANGQVTLKVGARELTAPLVGMDAAQAAAIADLKDDERGNLTKALFLIADGADADAAAKALAAAGKPPGLSYYQDRLAALTLGAAEVAARKAWAEIEAASKPKPTKAEAARLLALLDAFEKAHAGTKHFASVRDKLPDLRAQAQPAPKEPQWTSLFDGKTLDGWSPVEGGRFGQVPAVHVEGGAIILPGDKCWTGLRRTQRPPMANYEFEAEVMRVAGGGDFFYIVFPAEQERCAFIVGGWRGVVVGLDLVDAARADSNPTGTRATFEVGKWYAIRLRVTKEKVEAWIGGDKVVDLTRGAHRLALSGEFVPAAPFAIFAIEARTAVRNIRLRSLGAEPERPVQARKALKEPVPFVGKPLFIEAEVAHECVDPMAVAHDDAASGGMFVWQPGEVGQNGGAPDARVVFLISVRRDCTAYMWGRVLAPHKNDDSFFVGVAPGVTKTIERLFTWNLARHAQWEWVSFDARAHPDATTHTPTPVDLKAGVNSLVVAVREDGAKLDKICITPTPEPPPEEAKAGEWPFDAAEARRRQSEAAKALGVEAETDIALGGGAKMTLVLIPAGEFLMGSAPATSPEQLQKAFGGNAGEFQPEFPQRRARISKPFWLGKTEVTQAQWQAVMGGNPSHFKGKPQNPVDNVSWDDCQGFLQKLSAKFKRPFRLPTEAEWEYACRAGTATEFYFGDAPAALPQHAWFEANSGGSPQAAGKVRPNAWGLCDMAGNLREWCEDWFGPYDNAPQTDPQGPATGTNRVLRSGYWNGRPGQCRSAFRHMTTQTDRGALRDLGLRVCVAARGTVQAAQDVRPGEWQSLFDGKAPEGWKALERLDVPARDGTGVGGKARVEDGKLVVQAGQPLSGIAYTGDVPKQDYEVSLEAMKVSGGDTFCVIQFPVGSAQCNFVATWGRDLVGFECIDQLNPPDSPVSRRMTFERDKWYGFRLRVAGGRLQVWIDDEKVADLPLAGHRFMVPNKWLGLKPFGLGTGNGTCAAFRNIRLRRIEPGAAEGAKRGE
ncbi:MAG: DUF1080 domain-containing protein [Planctomycetes bacterium]|nr:DUF1080 domain-containing protein [Planctomycetota bacterium]